MKYKIIQAGEWVTPVMRGYKMVCCDCCLVHVLDFRVVRHLGGRFKVMFRARRDNRATAAARRKVATVKEKSNASRSLFELTTERVEGCDWFTLKRAGRVAWLTQDGRVTLYWSRRGHWKSSVVALAVRDRLKTSSPATKRKAP